MWTRGGEGVQKSENLADVINGCFLMAFSRASFSARIRSTISLSRRTCSASLLSSSLNFLIRSALSGSSLWSFPSIVKFLFPFVYRRQLTIFYLRRSRQVYGSLTFPLVDTLLLRALALRYDLTDTIQSC